MPQNSPCQHKFSHRSLQKVLGLIHVRDVFRCAIIFFHGILRLNGTKDLERFVHSVFFYEV